RPPWISLETAFPPAGHLRALPRRGGWGSSVYWGMPPMPSPMPRLALLALFLGSVAHAQDLPEPGDGFTWERVGDRGINVRDLAFGPDSTLWAAAPDGPFRLDTTQGFPGVWVLLQDFPAVGSLVVLGRGPQGDTLVTGLGSTRRSVDGGLTWEQVHDEGG